MNKKSKRTQWLMAISLVIYASNYFSFLVNNTIIEDPTFLKVLVIMIVKISYYSIGYFIICIFIIFMSHLTSSIYYFAKGYGLAPIICYPIVIVPSERKKIGFIINHLNINKYLYPKKLLMSIKENYDEHNISKICSNAHLYSFITQIIVTIVFAIVFLLLNKYFFAVSMIFTSLVYVSLAYTYTDSFHGLMIIRKNINDGLLVVYLANQMILYTNEENKIYNLFNECLMNEKIKLESLVVIETIKYMYMIKCFKPDFYISDFIEKITKDTLLIKSSLEIISNAIVGDEKLSLLKTYMYNAIINNDIGSRNIAVQYFEIMDKEASLAIVFKSAMKFYLDIGKSNIILKNQKNIIKYKLLRHNGLLNKFDNYYNDYQKIIEIMYNICEVI